MYQKLRFANTSYWKQFCLFLVIICAQFTNVYAQNYVNISLPDPVSGNGNPTTSGSASDYVIQATSGSSGIGIGWGANLYSASDVGASNKIYDLTWVSKSNVVTSNQIFDFKDVEIWMYHYNSDAFPDDNRPDVQGTITGASDITKVVSGKSLLVKTPSSGQCIYSLILDTPFDYVAGKNLVIYIQKTTPFIPSVIEGPKFFNNIDVNNKKRRLCNWLGTSTNPLPNTHDNNTSSQRNFARVMFNVGFTNTTPLNGTRGGQWLNSSGNPDVTQTSSMAQCFPPACTTPVISTKTTSICSNSSLNFTPTVTGTDVIPGGTTYKWSFTDNPNVTGESNETVGKTSIASTTNLVNTSATPQDVVYTVTPSSGTCVGTPFTLTVKVYPAPKINNMTKTLCSGVSFDTIPAVTGNIIPTGTKYTWTVPSPGTAQSTLQNSISQTTPSLTNTTNAPITVVYNVTASSATGATTPSPTECTSTFNLTVTVKPKPVTPTLGTPVDPTCALDGSVLISGLPSPLSGSTTWTLKSRATFNFSVNGNTATYNYTALKANSKIKFIVVLDGCQSDSTLELTVANAPGKPVLEGPSSVCVGSEITLKAWKDNTATPSKSTPDGTTPWVLKFPPIAPLFVDTITLLAGSDATTTFNKITGKKAGKATIVYKDNSGCTAEKIITVNPLPEIPILSHVPSSPLVFVGNKADTVCKGSDVEFTLTGGTISDKVYFKDSLSSASTPAPIAYLIKAQNNFNRKNVLADINVVIDSVSNGLCRINALPLKIVMADTALSLKAIPKSKCDLDDGKIEVTLSTLGKLSWTSNDLTTPITGSRDITSITSPTTTILNLKKANYTVSYYNGGCLLSKTTNIKDPSTPYLEGPTSVCVNSEITLKAWTDNTATPSKSTPNGTAPWTVKASSNDLDTVSLTTGTIPTITSNVIKGLKAASIVKSGVAVIVYKDINGCSAEHTIEVNPLPIVPILSHVPSSPLVFVGNKADTVCKGSNVDFTLTNGTTGDKVYFKDTVLTGTTTPKPYLIQATNIFNRKNVLTDINVVIDSVSNGLCKINALPLKIVMSDTALSLKSFPTSKCGSNDGLIEVKVSSAGKLIWKSNDLTTIISDSIFVTQPLVNDSIYRISNSLTPQAKLKKGNYTVSYYNGGCLLSKNTTISDPNKPFLEPISTVTPLSMCAGDSVMLKAWTDNTKTTKSIPKSSFSLRWISDNNNVTFKDSTNNLFTITKVIGASGGNSIVTYTDINECTADITITINSAGKPTTLNSSTDLNQQFCAADNPKVSNLKPTGLFWYDEKGKVNLALTTLLESKKYYAAIQDVNGCYTKKEDRIIVDVKINSSPNEPVVNKNQSFCKVDNPTVADLLPAPNTDIKWFLKSGSSLTEQLPTDKLGKFTYVVNKFKDGCLSPNGVEVNIDTIGVEKPQLPTQKLCSNNAVPLTLAGLYPITVSNYYFYDLSNVSLFPTQPVAVGEQYKVKQSAKGCLSEELIITISISDGPTVQPTTYNLTPAICKADNPTLASVEAKYAALPTTGKIYWYDAQNSSLTNELPKNIPLGGLTNKYWIAVKDADGCFSKKQEVVFSIDPGKKPDLKPIELCKTTNYTATDLNAANITNPQGILTWYLSETGPLIPSTVTHNNIQEYWASYKPSATECEGERVKLVIDWLDLTQNVVLSQTSQKFCKSGNKTVDDLDPAPYTDANITWFENPTITTPYPVAEPLSEKIYYAAEYKVTSAGDYCVNSNRIPVNVSLYSNKIYPVVKESVCAKQNGSIEFINPPAGLTFDWYEQNDPNTLDFTGPKYNKPLEKQSFKIKIKDALGCVEEVSVALPECTDSPIPQIVSPNGDNYNNKWVINYSGKYKNVQVRIFNRWGGEVYTSAIPYKDDWEGKSNNEYLPSGTYYYVIDKGNGDPIESGFIEFIK